MSTDPEQKSPLEQGLPLQPPYKEAARPSMSVEITDDSETDAAGNWTNKGDINAHGQAHLPDTDIADEPTVTLGSSGNTLQNFEPLAAGDLVGEHYQIERQLGQGGMSTVYRARHLLINRPVALKVLNETRSNDAKAVQRFQQEAKVISQLDHPNIVRLHEFGIDHQDRPFLVMDLVDGQSLEQFIAARGKLGPKEALEIAVDVAEALDHAHEKGIVHRDLKPSNIVLEKSSSGRLRAKVVDFGIAKLGSTTASQKLTQTGDTFGSPTYMSPEQCMGKEIGPRSDIYSLACVIVEMLTGRPLFEADMPIQVLAKHLNEKPMRLSNMKALKAERRHWTRQEATMMAALDRVLAKALNKNPDDRYRNAAEFAQDLLIVLTDPASLAKNVPLYISHLERKSLFGQSSYMFAGIVACGLIYLTVCAIYYFAAIPYPTNPFAPPPVAVEPVEPVLKLPETPVLQPTTFKQSDIMFDPLRVFDGLPSMHAYSDTLRSYTESLQAQQLKGWATNQDQIQLAHDSLNLGRIMVDSGNPKASINEFSRVIGLQDIKDDQQRDFSLDSSILQSAYLGLGDARLAMGNFAEALEAYLKAKSFYTRGDIFDDKLKQGLLAGRIGLCYEASGDLQSKKKAKDCLSEAVSLLSIKDPQDTPDRKIVAAAALGDIYLHQQQFTKALNQFDTALMVARDLPANFQSVNAVQFALLQCKKALCLGMLGQAKDSDKLFDSALNELLQDRPDETYLRQLLEPRVAYARAIVLKHEGRLKAALDQVRIGLDGCLGATRDCDGLKLALLKFGLTIVDPSQSGEERNGWQQQKKKLEAERSTLSIMPMIAIMQYLSDALFSE